jgi:hypothetical protein
MISKTTKRIVDFANYNPVSSDPLTRSEIKHNTSEIIEQLLNQIEEAWCLIANVHRGDWSLATEEWRKTAVEWRNKYHKILSIG